MFNALCSGHNAQLTSLRGAASTSLVPRRPTGRRACAVAAAQHDQDQHKRIQEKQTYLGEVYWQIEPVKQAQKADWRQEAHVHEAPKITLQSLNHAALEAADTQSLTNFYARVLGFEQMGRPDFPFGGAWLQGAGLLLHIIDQDPSVPRQMQSWKDKFAEEPETWYIRRANHLAFEVENAEAMEARLAFFGIEYTKVVIPGTDAFQLFFFDPEGNGVEVGCDYKKVAEMLKARSGKQTGDKPTAVSP